MNSPSDLTREKGLKTQGGIAMKSTLVIGTGDIERGDCGVGYYVVNALRQRFGQPQLAPDQAGFDLLGDIVDSVFVKTLDMDMMETASTYDRLIFVDFHGLMSVPAVSLRKLDLDFLPRPHKGYMGPDTFVDLTTSRFRVETEGYELSIRGYSCDFHRGLSRATGSLVEAAVNEIIELTGHDEFAVGYA